VIRVGEPLTTGLGKTLIRVDQVSHVDSVPTGDRRHRFAGLNGHRRPVPVRVSGRGRCGDGDGPPRFDVVGVAEPGVTRLSTTGVLLPQLGPLLAVVGRDPRQRVTGLNNHVDRRSRR